MAKGPADLLTVWGVSVNDISGRLLLCSVIFNFAETCLAALAVNSASRVISGRLSSIAVIIAWMLFWFAGMVTCAGKSKRRDKLQPRLTVKADEEARSLVTVNVTVSPWVISVLEAESDKAANVASSMITCCVTVG